MVKPKKISLLTIFCFATVFAIPQQVKNKNNGNKYLAIHWGVEQGLRQERWHTALLKDVNGFMWLGSHYGELSRFDGSSFQQYEPDKNKPGTIQSTNILSFVEDSLHNIWMGRSNGLSRYDIKADTFTNFTPFIDPTISNNEIVIPFWATKKEVFCIEGGLWITSYNIQSFTRKKLIHIAESDSVQLGFASASSAIFELSTNSVWMLAQNEEALVQFSLSTGKSYHFHRLVHNNKSVKNHHTDAEAMCYDRNRNCFWINSYDGLIQFTLKDRQFHHIDALDPLVNSKEYDRWVGIDIDHQGRIWMATKPKGIIIYDPVSESLIYPVEGTALQHKVADGNLKIYCDRDGIVWSTYWSVNGIYQLNPCTPSVQLYRAKPNNPDSLSSLNIYNMVSADQGRLWIGTGDQGLNIFNPKTGTFRVLKEKDLPGVKGVGIVPMAIDTLRKKAWLKAFPADRMYEMNMQTQQCKPVIFKDSSGRIISPANIIGIMSRPYKNGFLFFVAGLGIFELTSNSTIARLVIYLNGKITRMSIGEDNKLFLHSMGVHNNFTYYNIDGKWIKTAHTLDSIHWKDIFYDKADHTYWVGITNEVIHYNKDFIKIRSYTNEGGFISELYSLVPDGKGNIWFNNDHKLISCLNIKTGIITTLSDRDGYQSQYYDWTTPQGKKAGENVYFVGNALAQIISFDMVMPNKFVPSPPSLVYLRSLKINEHPFTQSLAINRLGGLSLRYFENKISIETGIIDYYSKDKSHIRYKLEIDGKNAPWEYAPAYYTIRFENLLPAKYNLFLQASNASNEYNGPVKMFVFKISPPFWNTWWFYALVTIITTSGVYAIFKTHLKQKLQVHNVRQKLHRDLHDDIGATLSSIKVYSDLLQNKGNDLVIIELIRTNALDMIDKLEVIAWATNPERDTLKGFKDLILKHALSPCNTKNIDLNIQCNGMNENMVMPGDLRQNLFLIFKEAINNIVKYSEASKCLIQMFSRGRKFYFIISDNGKGVTGTFEGNGNGWKNMQKRTQELKGTIKIQSEINKGTSITVTLHHPFKIPILWYNKKPSL